MDRVAIEMGDQITGLQPGAGSGGVVDWRYNLDQPIFHRHFDPEPAEFAAGLNLHVVEVFRIQVIRVGVERGQHAVDRRLDQRVVADFVDIIGAHALEHLAEEVELLIGFTGVGRCRCPDVLAQREH